MINFVILQLLPAYVFFSSQVDLASDMEEILDIVSDQVNHPQCPHGPTFLFCKTDLKKKNARNFFGCSANRNRKFCQFFLWADETISDEKRLMWQVLAKEHMKSLGLTKLRQIQKQLQSCPVNSELKFCKKCSLVLLPNSFSEHATHGFMEKLSCQKILKPTTLFSPLEENKTNAQYFFSDKCVRFIVESLKKFQIKKLLCVGTPRIFEYVSSNESTMDCLLLDIDHRYVQVFSPEKFILYNLFNHHFFEGAPAEKVVTEFVRCTEATAIIIDPPFGGLINSVAHTLKRISNCRETDCEALMPVVLFFPYFNEDRILKNLPSVKMLDYKVEYANHESFKAGGMKQGSPVRIYTNLDAKLFQLPSEEGYRYCPMCQRYISSENKHCLICDSCTSKDGRPYKHCEECGRCCKSSWEHCPKCNRCTLPQHACGIEEGDRCFTCHQPGHKHRNCSAKASNKKFKKKR